MRLIDADALREEHCDGCNPDVREDCKNDPICASLMWVHDAPTVDAIPVEQVARMLCEYAEDRRPCDRNDGYISSMRDEFCHECEARTNYPKNAYDCWLHAIKEGWLDDAE